ncbi:MAG: hypothetical protein KatS3mg103_0484 [Phycisphaerales bacterium]|nr:MAG: hypothetical protein KatS3mg103_0484 [Phycisphaerales bacterium]
MELYAESDLLLRALRDLAGSEVKEVIIDDLGALARAERFLKIAAPRSRPRLLHYTGKAPIFAAFGIEQQIQNIYSREVPLPSGGRLIFEETEALVAIDVNSGRSRSAKDAETNALNTNLEAADEICRQLRLRDMGGAGGQRPDRHAARPQPQGGRAAVRRAAQARPGQEHDPADQRVRHPGDDPPADAFRATSGRTLPSATCARAGA